ncbi:MAG: hypothetical protein RDU89_04970 [bacterium]|nr:hypothetical protein [bacterium]
MRVFGVEPDNRYREYRRVRFDTQHEEKLLEDWLEANPEGILEAAHLLIIGRQVATDLGGLIDLLGVDREGDVVVIELKRSQTPRDTLAQALEYASFAARLDTEQLTTILQRYLNDESLSLAQHHREYFELAADEAVAFNKDQHIVIVGQEITRSIRQTASFLCNKELRVACVEFTFFEDLAGTRLLSQEVVVGAGSRKPRNVVAGSLPLTTEREFLESLDDNGRQVFSHVLGLAKEREMPVHWGTKGFSVNVNLSGVHAAVCSGYPPQSVYKQSLYTALVGQGGMEKKTAVPEQQIADVRRAAQATGLFAPAGGELKCLIERRMSVAELTKLSEWIESVAGVIQQYGPRSSGQE